MNQSQQTIAAFEGLSCVLGDDAMHIAMPGHIIPQARAQSVKPSAGVMVGSHPSDPDGWQVNVARTDQSPLDNASRFFSALHQDPAPATPSAILQPAPEPVVSIIIVLNENLPFLQQRLIPSLLSTTTVPFEIIVVWNGSVNPAGLLDAGIRLIQSQPGAVAAAYNAGAAAARAPLLAFFHDDCIVDDPEWLERARNKLESGADAVGAEVRQLNRVAGCDIPPLPVIKTVPLVLTRDRFLDTGGFNEWHHAGYEDLDFTLTLLASGARIAAIDMRIRHYSGMSSTLKYCPIPGLDSLYAVTALPRSAIVKRFREFARQGIYHRGHDYFALAMQAQLLHVLEHHRTMLDQRDPDAFRRARDIIRSQLEAQQLETDQIMHRFRALDAAYPATARTTAQ